MNKKEFIDYIEKRLNILDKNEIEDIVNEYIQHIDNKLSEGMSEKDAVATLGNCEDLVREILLAYNINPDYEKAGKEDKSNIVYDKIKEGKKIFSDMFKNVCNFVSKGLNKLKEDEYSFKKIMGYIIKYLLIVLVIIYAIPYIAMLAVTLIAFAGFLVLAIMGYPFLGVTIGLLGFNISAICLGIVVVKLAFFNKGVAK